MSCDAFLSPKPPFPCRRHRSLSAVTIACAWGLPRYQLKVGSSTRNECSVFTIGRIMLRRTPIRLSEALAAIIAATEEAVPMWG